MNGLVIIMIFCLGMFVYSLKTGTLIMRGRFDRYESPVNYWFGTISYAILSVAALVTYLMVKLKQP